MAARRNNGQKFLSTSALTIGLFALGSSAALAMDDFTTPTGEQIVGGAASFDRPDAATLNVTQGTDRVVINWDSFNIGAKAKTEFFQPGAGSLAVNRVISKGADPTQILGTLKANGRVMVLDRNGVFFGAQSRVDVGGIVASTGDVDNSAVMRGDTVLELSNFGDASVINNGTISVIGAGLAALVAPHAVNNGVIEAKLGKVALASGGERATVDLYGDGLVEIALGGTKGKALAENNGTIEGATVLMTASGAKDVVDTVINMNGVIKATSVTRHGGKIILGGGNAGKVEVSGTLDANGANGGGTIDVRGYDIDVTQTALLSADATGQGNGGRSIVFANNRAIINGRMSARGGLLGGNGGFIETSGLELGVGASAAIDMSAPLGNGGLWLLDPLSIVVSDELGATVVLAGGTEYQNINTGVLETALNGGDVTIETGDPGTFGSTASAGFFDQNDGDIYIRSDIDYSGAASRTLTLIAHDDIGMENNAQINRVGTGNLSLNFLADNGADGRITIGTGSTINTNGGSVAFTASSGIRVNDDIVTNGGAVTLSGHGLNFWDNAVEIAHNGKIDTNGGNVTINADHGKAVINGQVLAGTGDLDLLATNQGRIEFWGAGVLQGDTVNLESDLGVTQGALGKIDAATLTGKSNFSTILDGQNEIDTIGTFETGNASNAGGFTLNEADGFNITGTVSTKGGAIDLKTGSDNFFEAVTLAATGSLVSEGGAINVDLNGAGGGAFVVNGTIDSRGTVDGDVTLNARQLQLKNNSAVYAGLLTVTGGLVTQNAGSAITAAGLTGSLTADAKFNGAGNDIGTLYDFTTGTGSNAGGFALNDSTGGLNVGGVVSTDGGNIAIGTTGDLTLQAGAVVTANGGNIDLTQSGRFTADSGSVRTAGAGSINLDQNAGGSVQNAIDAISNSGSGQNMLDVGAGTYEEQLNIAKNLTLKGAGIGVTTILSPVTLAAGFSGNKPVIYVHDTDNVVIDGLTVDGAGRGNANYRFVGIGYDNAGGAITNSEIKNIANTPFSGVQGGIGIMAAVDNNIARTLNITGNTVTGFQKNGMSFSGSGLSGAIVGNIVTGAGSTTLIAQNGIQVSGGALATITGNTISGISYSPRSFAATGILILEAADGTIVTGNTITGSGHDIAIYAYGTDDMLIAGNTINGTSWYGIEAYETDNAVIAANTVGGAEIGIESFQSDNVQLVANTITQGAGAIGIRLDGGANQTAFANTVTGGKNGIVALNTTGTTTIISNTANGATDTNAGRVGSLYTTGIGILVDGATGPVKIIGNTANGNLDGIRLLDTNAANAGDVQIIINTANNNADKGIIVNNSDKAQVWTNTAEGNATGIWVELSDNVDLSFNQIKSSTAEGIHLRNSKNTFVQFNTVLKNAQNGIWIEKSNSAALYGNTIGGSGVSTGVKITGTSNAVIGSDVFSNQISDFDNGVTVSGGTNNDIVNNTIDGVDYGIRLSGASGADIRDNRLTGNSVTGIDLAAGSHNATITGNTLDHFITGIAIASSNGVTIDDNTLTDVKSGIVADLANNLTITDNDLTGRGTGGTGIAVSNSDLVTIGGSDISVLGFPLGSDGINTLGGFRNGITADNVSNLHIRKNTLTGFGDGTGLRVDDSAGAKIGGADTIIVLTTNYGSAITGFKNGIVVKNSDGAKIANNAVLLSAENGITVTGSKLAVIDGNLVALFGANGIEADNSNKIVVTSNIVGLGFGNGIAVTDSKGGTIARNLVGLVIGDGIFANRARGLTVDKNLVTFAGDDGIDVNRSDNAVITGNTINNITNNGIEAQRSDGATIAHNNVSAVYGDGIFTDRSNRAVIRKNTLNDIEGDGVDVRNGKNIRVRGNSIDDTRDNGIEATDVDNLHILRNDIGLNDRIGGNGVDISGGENALVKRNVIQQASRNGIRVDGNRNVDIDKNAILGSGRDGLHVRDSNRAAITRNIILFSGQDGIDIRNSRNATVDKNLVAFFVDNGIEARNSENIAISRNRIALGLGDGIVAAGSQDSTIAGNRIFLVSGNGITLEPTNGNYSDGSVVDGNRVRGVGRNGIYAYDTYGLEITNNRVRQTGANGIYVEEGSDTLIERNTIRNFGGSGIRINEDFGTANITGNIIRNGRGWFSDGIRVSDADILNIDDNIITGVAGDGIDVDDSRRVNIRRNVIDATGNNGIEVSDNRRVLITDNILGLSGNIGGNGIDASDNRNLRIARNVIDGADENGVLLDGNDRVRLLSNLISNSGFSGLYAAGGSNGTIVLEDNSFTDNPVGAWFESGDIDLTGAANTFNGGDVALRFAPFAPLSPLNLIGNTIGTSVFNGQSIYYVELANGALFAPGLPTVINGLDATYDGFKPSDFGGILTQAQFDALEGKIYHYGDDPTLGLIFFGAVPGLNDNDVYNNYAGPSWASGRFRMTILGLPGLPGSGNAGNNGGNNQGGFIGNVADFLANLAPAAGGDDDKKQNQSIDVMEELAGLEPAAGDQEDPACWSEAVAQASAGATVNYSFGGTAEENLNQAAACGGAI